MYLGGNDDGGEAWRVRDAGNLGLGRRGRFELGDPDGNAGLRGSHRVDI
jgi:hypothetical protein